MKNLKEKIVLLTCTSLLAMSLVGCVDSNGNGTSYSNGNSTITSNSLEIQTTPTIQSKVELLGNVETEVENSDLLGLDDFDIVGTVLQKYNGSDAIVTIPEGITEVGVEAFVSNNTLTQVIFPSTLTTIDSNAFAGCDGLTEVTIPDSVTELGLYAFQMCNNLTEITLGENIEIFANPFRLCGSLDTVNVKAGSLSEEAVLELIAFGEEETSSVINKDMIVHY